MKKKTSITFAREISCVAGAFIFLFFPVLLLGQSVVIVEKTVVDVNGLPVDVGDVLRYRVTAYCGVGLPPGGASFSYKDPLPPEVTFLQITGCDPLSACVYNAALNQVCVGGGKLRDGADVLIVEYEVTAGCTSDGRICNQGTLNTVMVGDVLTDGDLSTPDIAEPTCIDGPICLRRMLKGSCAAASGCDVGSLFPLAAVPGTLADPPACFDDPETGILSGTAKPLALYQITMPSHPNSVACIKNRTGDTVTVCY